MMKDVKEYVSVLAVVMITENGGRTMRIIKPSYEILTEISDGGIKELQFIERIGRVCYKSEDKISDDGESSKKFVKMLVDLGHEAMIEHSQLTVKFTCDRGVSHEIVRHRVANYAQESTRYVNYGKEKFGREITVVKPFYLKKDSPAYIDWFASVREAESRYMGMLDNGCTPQEARAVLPNSTKTEIVMTANYREWRHFLKLRTATDAHPQMRELTVPLLKELQQRIPIVFDDIVAK
jgi:thymidylate synthase (FAD)